MKAHPADGDFYRQEFDLGNAEDCGEVESLSDTVTVPAGTFMHCLKTPESTPLEPDLHEAKWYAPGVGQILTLDLGARPNRVPGCKAELSGSAESRLKEWFNTSCFSQPNAFTFGNEPRVDSSLRQQGILNFDFAVFKRTTFGPAERLGLEFRTEFFNLFNHPQFGPPDSFLPSASFGSVHNTVNNPRLIQFAMKFAF